MNNFKKMLEEDELRFKVPPSDIESGIRGDLKTIRHAGEIADLYFAKMLDVLVGFAGGKGISTLPHDRLPDKERDNDPGAH